MISKKQVSFIKSLSTKKHREETGLFIVEGEKICNELMQTDYEIEKVYYTSSWSGKDSASAEKASFDNRFEEVEQAELEKISLLKTPNKVLALVKQKAIKFTPEIHTKGPVLMLDNLQDPGNLGTIIRTAEWFGFYTVIASLQTVDIYSPKVVQAAMGSLFRINYLKQDLIEIVKSLDQHIHPAYATVLGGKNIYTNKMALNGVFILGNEANGVSLSLQSLVNEHLGIPLSKVSKNASRPDSLNVAVAGALIMAEYYRQHWV